MRLPETTINKLKELILCLPKYQSEYDVQKFFWILVRMVKIIDQDQHTFRKDFMQLMGLKKLKNVYFTFFLHPGTLIFMKL